MNEAVEKKRKPQQGRSPGYPSIDLGEAIEKAKTLWELEGRNSIATDVVFDHWHYGAKSSSGRLVLAALKKYGLLQVQGGMAQLTEAAIAIITDEREDPAERQARIWEAAQKPAIFNELLNKYQERLPTDASIRHYLLNERKFTSYAADQVIRAFRNTLAFAKPSESDMMFRQDDDKTPQGAEAEMGSIYTKPLSKAPEQRTVRSSPSDIVQPFYLPSIEDPVTITLPKRLTETEWDEFDAILKALRPGLTDSSELICEPMEKKSKEPESEKGETKDSVVREEEGTIRTSTL